MKRVLTFLTISILTAVTLWVLFWVVVLILVGIGPLKWEYIRRSAE